MNKTRSVFILAMLIILPLFLTGCIGEEYNESPPEAFLQVGDEMFILKEINRKWNFTHEDYDKEYINLKELAAKD